MYYKSLQSEIVENKNEIIDEILSIDPYGTWVADKFQTFHRADVDGTTYQIYVCRLPTCKHDQHYKNVVDFGVFIGDMCAKDIQTHTIELGVEMLLEKFKETHFCYEEDGVTKFAPNDDASSSQFALVLYDALEDAVGREFLFEELKKTESSMGDYTIGDPKIGIGGGSHNQ